MFWTRNGWGIRNDNLDVDGGFGGGGMGCNYGGGGGFTGGHGGVGGERFGGGGGSFRVNGKM